MTTSGSTPTTAPEHAAPATVHVAVGVLRRDDGRVLVTSRAAERHAGGGLEFPGGKIEPGESEAAALARELDEELGIGLGGTRPLIRVGYRYPECLVDLHVAGIDHWRGEPAGREDQRLYWLAPEELDPADFPAANRPIIAALAWPAILRVTPGLADAGDADAFRPHLHAALSAGDTLVQLRAPALERKHWRALVDAASAVRPGPGSPPRIVLNTAADDPAVARHGTGLHLSASAASALVARPPQARFLSCAAHDEAELARAEALGADCAVVGPVQATPSHPGASGIGWPRLAALAASTALPVYAIGGLRPTDVDTARRHGAVGVAGIRDFWPQGHQ